MQYRIDFIHYVSHAYISDVFLVNARRRCAEPTVMKNKPEDPKALSTQNIVHLKTAGYTPTEFRDVDCDLNSKRDQSSLEIAASIVPISGEAIETLTLANTQSLEGIEKMDFDFSLYYHFFSNVRKLIQGK